MRQARHLPRDAIGGRGEGESISSTSVPAFLLPTPLLYDDLEAYIAPALTHA